MLADYLPSLSGLIGEQDINPWYHNKYGKQDSRHFDARTRRSVQDETHEKGILEDDTEKTMIVHPGQRLAKMIRSFADMVETFDG